MTEKRFIVIDVPYENGEPFLYKKMLDKTTKKEYDNTLKGIDDMCDLSNHLHEENKQLNNENKSFKAEIEQLRKCYNNALDEMDTLAEVNDKFYKENNELKQLIDLFAQDICNLTEILSKNQLDYNLHSDVENFIIKWGVRIE